MKEYKLIVAGGRDFDDYLQLTQTLMSIADEAGDKFAISIVSGMAKGADALGYRFAKTHGVTCYEFPADWSVGKNAGYVRNQRMGEFADGLLAFWDGQSKGTAHMIRIMREMGKPVHVVHYGERKEAEAGAPAPAQASEALEREVVWTRWGGYECSSKGDQRFSALFARMPDGRTIEEHYQCDVKGYQPGGTNWRLGKGKPPLLEVDLWEEYLALWRIWAIHNHALMCELVKQAKKHSYTLSDRFATTEVNQAHALATVLNETFYKEAKEETVPPWEGKDELKEAREAALGL